MSEARGAAPLQRRREGKGHSLLLAVDVPPDLDAPDLLLFGTEPELAEGDSHLGRPAYIRDLGFGGPDGIPRRVPAAPSATTRPATAAWSTTPASTAAAGGHCVPNGPRGIDAELVRCLVVVVAVQADRDEIEVPLTGVATCQAGRHHSAVVEQGSDVDGIIVVSDAELGALAGRSSLVGILLDEVVDGWCLRPDCLIQTTVELDRRGAPECASPRSQIVVVLRAAQLDLGGPRTPISLEGRDHLGQESSRQHAEAEPQGERREETTHSHSTGRRAHGKGSVSGHARIFSHGNEREPKRPQRIRRP